MTLSAAFIQPGDVVELTAPYDRLGGQGALVGTIFGVAACDVLSTVTAGFHVEGVFSLAKTSAQAWTQGQVIYWDDTNKRLDSDGTLGQRVGRALVVAANPSSTGIVMLDESAPGRTASTVATLTDSSGGATVNGTIEAVTDSATAANAVKELATKLNELITKLHAVGIVA